MALLSEPSQPEALSGKCTGWHEALEIAKGATVKLWNLGFVAGVKCQPVQHSCWEMIGKSVLIWFKKMLWGTLESCRKTIRV